MIPSHKHYESDKKKRIISKINQVQVNKITRISFYPKKFIQISPDHQILYEMNSGKQALASDHPTINKQDITSNTSKTKEKKENNHHNASKP